MKQFKELSIDEQLDLVKHVLEGSNLSYNTPEQREGTVFGDTEDIHISTEYFYKKQPTKLETLYKEKEEVQERIEAELKRLGKPVTRDNTSSVQSPSKQEKTSESGTMERITLENWKSLGIEVGDKVNVISTHEHISGIYSITEVEDLYYDEEGFIELDYAWWWYEDTDEVYLIRTK